MGWDAVVDPSSFEDGVGTGEGESVDAAITFSPAGGFDTSDPSFSGAGELDTGGGPTGFFSESDAVAGGFTRPEGVCPQPPRPGPLTGPRGWVWFGF